MYAACVTKKGETALLSAFVRMFKVGDEVEFETNYPGHEGETVRGTITHVGSDMFPANPQVSTYLGSHEVLKSDLRPVLVGPFPVEPAPRVSEGDHFWGRWAIMGQMQDGSWKQFYSSKDLALADEDLRYVVNGRLAADGTRGPGTSARLCYGEDNPAVRKGLRRVGEIREERLLLAKDITPEPEAITQAAETVRICWGCHAPAVGGTFFCSEECRVKVWEESAARVRANSAESLRQQREELADALEAASEVIDGLNSILDLQAGLSIRDQAHVDGAQERIREALRKAGRS